jgi:hypothetical protein
MSKVEQQFEKAVYLQEYTEYNQEELDSLFVSLKDNLQAAKGSGLTSVFVQFRSTLEPYEDNSCGPVEVQIRGYRDLNKFEIIQAYEQSRIQLLADSLGVSYYEASVVDRLRASGKVIIK